jgi:hypothetical protein
LDQPAQSIRPCFTILAKAPSTVVFAIFSKYVGLGVSTCNAPAGPPVHIDSEPTAMTTFDKREEAFEKRFALDEEETFKAVARRNKLMGLWAAERLGKDQAAAVAYAREVVAAEFEDGGDKAVIRKLMRDLSAKGVAIGEEEIRRRMAESFAVAIAQVKAGT